MVIEKIEIESFGGLKDYTLEFSDGFNLLYGGNEAGKSTVCAFLHAMFYGFPNESKRLGIREDFRKRYAPWDGAKMAGRVTFRTGEGRRYVLSRRLGATSKRDKVQLLDGATWEEIPVADPENVGREFLGVGADGFLKTLYVSQLGAAIAPGKEDEILAKLSNLERSGDEDTSYSKAAGLLENAKYALVSRNGRGGAIPALEAETEALREELAETRRLCGLYRDDLTAAAELEQKSVRLSEEAKQLAEQKERAKQAEAAAQREKWKQERAALETRRNAAAEKLKAAEEHLAQCRETLRGYPESALGQERLERLLTLEQEQKRLREELDKAAELERELDALLAERRELSGRTKRAVNIPMLLVALLVAGISIATAILFTPVLLVLLIPGIFLGVVSVMGKKQDKETRERLVELDGLIRGREEQAETARSENAAERLKQAEAEAKEILAGAGAADSRAFSEKRSARERALAETEFAVKEKAMLEEALRQAESDFARLPQEQEEMDSGNLPPYDGPDAETLDRLSQKKHEEQLACREALSAVRLRLESRLGTAREAGVIETCLQVNEEKLEEYRLKYDAVCHALTVLEQCRDELKSDFAPVLGEAVRDIVAELTAGRYGEVRVSEGYGMMLKNAADGGIVSAEYLSGGTYDLLYLALRLAILRVLYSGKAPLLVLDDAFLQFDDGRSGEAVRYLLREMPAEQILYFTCHESQAERLSKNEGVRRQNLPPRAERKERPCGQQEI